jgi:hypothetical protein
MLDNILLVLACIVAVVLLFLGSRLLAPRRPRRLGPGGFPRFSEEPWWGGLWKDLEDRAGGKGSRGSDFGRRSGGDDSGA